MTEAADHARAARIAEVFGGFRAEWLSHDLFNYFTQPSYFPELETPRPCVLSGGRGTGKTTVLMCLSYEGRFALSSEDASSIPDWNYYGVYYRVDTNRVPAFAGPELSARQWQRLFAHYLNLILAGKLLDFLVWRSDKLGVPAPLTAVECRRLATTLQVSKQEDLDGLRTALVDAHLEFEAYLNNIDPSALPKLSMQGAPITYLTDTLSKKPEFAGKTFFFLIDEYENLLKDQQVVVNTLIKHSSATHTYKIGIKELGWKTTETLSPEQTLTSPADFALVDIGASLAEAGFADLAQRVLNARLKDVFPEIPDILGLLPELPLDDEAEMLGVHDHVRDFDARLGNHADVAKFADGLRPLQKLFILFWAKSHPQAVPEIVRAWRRDPDRWNVRYENNKYALLFTIRRGLSGTRKYYSGWSVYVKLAAGNLRYLLELCVQALIQHARDGGGHSPVPHRIQTSAAVAIAEKNFRQLDNSSLQSNHLAMLLLGLGRVFYVMARQPEGHAPEVNQFHVGDDGAGVPQELAVLLEEGVRHLALIRWKANKLSLNDPQSFDYAIHPIFAPLFVFSHRKKRKMKVEAQTLLDLVDKPRDTIAKLVRRAGRQDTEELPEQLSLFEGYYGKSAA